MTRLPLIGQRPSWHLERAARVGLEFRCPCEGALPDAEAPVACFALALFANPLDDAPRPAPIPGTRHHHRQGDSLDTYSPGALTLSPEIRGACGLRMFLTEGELLVMEDRHA